MSEREERADVASSGRGQRRESRRLLRIGAACLALAVTGVSTASCSLIVDTNTNQCQPSSLNQDCGSFPGFRQCSASGANPNVCAAADAPPACDTNDDCLSYANATCNTSTHRCTRPCTLDVDCGKASVCLTGSCVPGAGEDIPCTKSSQCSSLPTGACRKGKCVSLVTPECPVVYATKTTVADAYTDDSAVFFGSILPSGSQSDGPFGRLIEDGFKLALDDFNKAAGIPGVSGGHRPIVVVACNDGENEDDMVRETAARHLIDDVGVPAIIGYAFSGSTISLAQEVTIPDNVLLFSSSATSAQITEVEKTANGLLWRTCPSDKIQAQALAAYYPKVEAAARQKWPITGNVKVAILNHNDAYGSGLGDAVQDQLTFNNASALSQSGTNYLRIDYGSADSPNLDKISQIKAFSPHVIFLFGFNEGPDAIFKNVEAQWKASPPSDGHFPFWIFSDGGQVGSLWSTTTGTTTVPADISEEGQRARVSGTVPGVNQASWPPYGAFLSEFNASSYTADGSADTMGPAGAYDILYLLAYSTVMLGTNELTGPNLVQYGLKNIQKAGASPAFQFNRNNIISTLNQIAANPGMPINVAGVSGPLPFDGNGDITTGDIQIWCVPKNNGSGDVGLPAINSGLYFDSATGTTKGCISNGCSLPENPSNCP